jgi:hypothetical protein
MPEDIYIYIYIYIYIVRQSQQRAVMKKVKHFWLHKRRWKFGSLLFRDSRSHAGGDTSFKIMSDIDTWKWLNMLKYWADPTAAICLHVFVFIYCVWPNYGSAMSLVARLDNIFFFFFLTTTGFITSLNYDDQTVVLQVSYERNCAKQNLELDLFWEQKCMKLLRKKNSQKYSSYGHARYCWLYTAI